MKISVVVPAKGNSNRLKDKNLVKNQMDEENQLHADKDIIQDEGDENNIDILEEDSDDETTTIINID